MNQERIDLIKSKLADYKIELSDITGTPAINASPNDMESFHKTSFKLLNGKGLIIVRPSIKPGS